MTEIKVVKFENESKNKIVEIIRNHLSMAERGEIQDIAIVTSIRDDDGIGCGKATVFRDRLRLIGAIEYAKDAVIKG